MSYLLSDSVMEYIRPLTPVVFFGLLNLVSLLVGGSSKGFEIGIVTMLVFLTGFNGLRFVRDVLVSRLVIYWPGYCYLILFPVDCRFDVMRTHGPDPEWLDIEKDPKLDKSICINYRHCIADPWIVHIWVDQNGADIKSKKHNFSGLKIGRTYGFAGKLRILEFVSYVQQLLRLMMWATILVHTNGLVIMIAILITIIGLMLKKDCWMAAFYTVVVLNLYGNWLGMVFVGLVWFLINRLVDYMYYGWWESEWRQTSPFIPDTTGYPEGIGPSNVPHQFNVPNANSNYSREDFTEDTNIQATTREAFILESGVVNTRTRATGNPHRVPAMVRNFFKWTAPDVEDVCDYAILLGSTWKGWGCRMTGIAIQPCFSDSDAATLHKYPGRPGYGQQVVKDHVATNCGPVGDGPNYWDPGWNVNGLAGAPIWMSHCYDIPVKAMLAIADRNNSKSVYVIMHACPSMFLDAEGVLPWTGQKWTTHEDNTMEWRWVDTTGATYKSNLRVHYEHFFTEYVHTSPGVYYWSDIVRQVLDVYLIRWTRSDKRPLLRGARTLKCELPHLLVRIPMLSMEPQDIYGSVKYLDTLKMFEEYTHTAKQNSDFEVTARSLVDNYIRNQDVKVRYWDHCVVRAVWRAELVRRHLVELSEKGRDMTFSWLHLLGVKRDFKYLGLVADKLISMLKAQPIRSETFMTLYQERSYLTRMKPLPKVIRRIKLEIPPHPDGTVLSQQVLDRKNPMRVTLLDGQGVSIAEQLCFCLFGKTRDVGAIIPVGESSKGGSKLTHQGTNLLTTEIEYLIQELGVVFVVLENDSNVPVYFAKLFEEDDRPPIVYIDFKTGIVSRVHYPMGIPSNRVLKIMCATKDDLANNYDWTVQLNGTPRVYARVDTVTDDYKAVLSGTLIKARYKATTEKAVILDTALANLGAYTEWTIMAGSTAQDIPIVNTNDHYPQYDRMNHIEGSLYPAPHHFCLWTVEEMRLIKRAN